MIRWRKSIIIYIGELLTGSTPKSLWSFRLARSFPTPMAAAAVLWENTVSVDRILDDLD
jgi:hypothetical protein